ncbi:MAG: ABC transporter permease [Anaerolineae bacterium]|nr:ABC transporter permease [Anaerolineae bacterium]
MNAYVARKLLSFIPTLLGVSILVFGAMRLIPGNQITATLGTEAGMLSEAQREALERYYGLDKPVVQQYVDWLAQAIQGNLGFSVRFGQPVTDLIIAHFPLTFQLTIMSLAIALVVGVPLGLLAAIRHNTAVDFLVQVLAIIGLSMPNFLIGTLIIYVLSVYFGVLPTAGNYVSLTADPLRNLSQLIFPALTLGFAFAASLMRTTRSIMLEALSEDYIRTARSKGLRERVVVRRHALRNGLIPIITLVGVQMGYLFGGTFIVEQIFALPGIGRLLVNAISQREYALVQGVVLFIALSFLIINLVVDLIYAVVDPRISYASKK